MEKHYLDYALEQLEAILNIPSPSGYTAMVAEYLNKELKNLGYQPWITNKGGVMVDLGGENGDDAIVLSCHVDTLGGMVHTVKDNGRLKLTPLGLLSPNNTEAENVTVHTRDGKIYTGCFQLVDPAWHVNGQYNDLVRTFDNMELVVDEKTASRAETLALGITAGDIVCFNPRYELTPSGFIKSRFLDDKLSSAILLALAKQIQEEKITTKRRIFLSFTVYEEVGHGAGGPLPEGTTEIIAVDMGCVGEGLDCDETMVSICAKDSQGPCSYEVVSRLVELAKANGIDYAVDVYPYYGSDADVAVRAGHDVKHCTMGAGVAASHGYERSHVDGLKNTYDLVAAYVL